MVYPPFSLAVMASGLKVAMQIGVGDRARLSDEAVRAVQAPFASADARRALCKAGHGLHIKGFGEIARKLPSLTVPIRAIHGARDRILPEVAPTTQRIARELPQTELTVLDDCGHFCQEERPAEIAHMLSQFFTTPRPAA